ncbi:hypothetical protein BPULL_1703 [Bifidobacterium pullorum]|uniref:Uncharacterized protein n=1 Tax=Bifidobacterium pullorum TaxID=78448 RepID=A0A7V8KRE1_9BIFI|nr:hypothetical protein BPULL_1703 [Bifidobacterium pullorum]
MEFNSDRASVATLPASVHTSSRPLIPRNQSWHRRENSPSLPGSQSASNPTTRPPSNMHTGTRTPLFSDNPIKRDTCTRDVAGERMTMANGKNTEHPSTPNARSSAEVSVTSDRTAYDRFGPCIKRAATAALASTCIMCGNSCCSIFATISRTPDSKICVRCVISTPANGTPRLLTSNTNVGPSTIPIPASERSLPATATDRHPASKIVTFSPNTLDSTKAKASASFVLDNRRCKSLDNMSSCARYRNRPRTIAVLID